MTITSIRVCYIPSISRVLIQACCEQTLFLPHSLLKYIRSAQKVGLFSLDRTAKAGSDVHRLSGGVGKYLALQNAPVACVRDTPCFRRQGLVTLSIHLRFELLRLDTGQQQAADNTACDSSLGRSRPRPRPAQWFDRLADEASYSITLREQNLVRHLFQIVKH